MSEISELFANVWVEKDEKKHIEKKKEHKKIEKHPKNEKQEIETKHVEKKKEIHKKLHSEGVKIQKNALKKDIVNNWVHFDKYIAKNMMELSKALDISTIWLERVIDRESWFDKNAKSPTWAKWIMQLTGAPLIDMIDKSNWAKNYLHIIRKIPDDSISAIKNKWIKIAFERIKDWDIKDYNRNIKEITSRAKNDPYCNFIVWCIHLARLKEEADPHNISEKKQVIANLKKVENKWLKEVNQLLIAKNKAPITNKDIDDIISKLHKNPEYYKNFVSYINYNWDNKKQAWIPHKYLYAVAIVKWKDQTA